MNQKKFLIFKEIYKSAALNLIRRYEMRFVHLGLIVCDLKPDCHFHSLTVNLSSHDPTFLQ